MTKADWFGFCYGLAFMLLCTEAHADNWIRFYESGRLARPGEIGKGPRDNYIPTNYYFVDADSIRPEGALLRYRTREVLVDAEGATEHVAVFEMIADCEAKTHAQLPSRDLVDTYEGTMSGDEVKAACSLANQRSH